MKKLTKRQREILDFIKSFIKKHNYPPTIREVADSFEISVKGGYDHIKAIEKKEYIWPHGSYRLSTIGKRGGLCVDQAYYTSHAAKAKGVPNIIFLGQGNSGEHAWIGFLVNYGRDFRLQKIGSWAKLGECLVLQKN